MHKNPSSTIVTITDEGFALAVYILCLSLRYHGVRTKVNVLSISLTDTSKALFQQLPHVEIFDADTSVERHPAARKAEAILTASASGSDFISLLDGDCIVTGNISRHLVHAKPGIYSRHKSEAEDAQNYHKHYRPNEARNRIPEAVLEIWRSDVSQRKAPRIVNTIASGNITIHRDYLDFVRLWDQQMLKILTEPETGTHYISHDFNSVAYSQLDESVFNSLLAFAEEAPPIGRGCFDVDDSSYVAHLGPHPKYWNMWSLNKLPYFSQVICILNWARNQGYQLPDLPWTLKAANKPWIVLLAQLYEVKLIARAVAAHIRSHVRI